MKSHVAFRLLLFTVLLLFAALTAMAQQQAITGKVVGVTDGDTVTVLDAKKRQYKIRLNGIDAPESNQDFGQVARQKLSGLVFGKDVTVIWNKTDRNDRILGTVTLGSIDTGLEQIRAGLAWYFRRYESDVPAVERHLYVAAEAEAKAQKLGLWGQTNPIAPWDWRDRKESPTPDSPLSAPAPPTRSDTSRSTNDTNRRSYSVQCSATTKRGTRCLRMTLSPNGRCWQHGGN